MGAGIYTITSPSGKMYIGQTINLYSREKSYRLVRCKSQTKLYYSIKKHGWEAHQFQAIMPLKDNLPQSIMTYWEQFFIDFYRNNGIELLNIREAGTRGRLSEETKKKMSASLKTRPHKPCSIETKLKLSIINTGKKQTKETNDKKRVSMLNRGKSNITSNTLTESDVILIRQLLANKGHQRTIAKKFGVSPSVISSIKHGNSWKNIPIKNELLGQII